MSQAQKDNLRYWSLAGPIWSMLGAIIAFTAWTVQNHAKNEQLWNEQLRINSHIEQRLSSAEVDFREHRLDYVALVQCLKSKGIHAIR